MEVVVAEMVVALPRSVASVAVEAAVAAEQERTAAAEAAAGAAARTEAAADTSAEPVVPPAPRDTRLRTQAVDLPNPVEDTHTQAAGFPTTVAESTAADPFATSVLPPYQASSTSDQP